MVIAGTPTSSVRVGRAEVSRLAWAFLISICIHLLVWGGYHGGKSALAWIEVHHPEWLQTLQKLAFAPLIKHEEPKKEPLSDPPLMFVDVNPSVATDEAPPNAKFESDKNSKAANPDTDIDSNIPKIAGNQNLVPKAEDVPHEKKQEVMKLVPVIPAQKGDKEAPAEKSRPSQEAGDTHQAKPDDVPKIDIGEAPKPKPRTIAEAMARQPDVRIPGPAMKQEGGVKRHLEIAALDVKATLFGAYESTLVAAISQRWFDLLDERNWAADNRGKVVIKFSLHYDGTITGVKVNENTTGAEVLGYVCVKAIQDPAPYAPWPSDMRHEIASGVFEVQFTFYY